MRARAEATAFRAVGAAVELPVYGVVAAGVASVIAVGASVALAVSAIPAAVFGPLALAYEPVRRTVKPLRKKTNHLAVAASSGVILTGVALCQILTYESD